MSVAIDPQQLKVAELKKELDSRGLDSSGLKASLVKRLQEAIDAEAAAAAPKKSTGRGKAKAKEEEQEEKKEEEEQQEEAQPSKRTRKAPVRSVRGKKPEPESEESEDEEAPPAKVAKVVPVAPPATKAKAASKSTQKTYNIPVDSACPVSSSAKVVGEYDAMLNQTNIGQNNNKYYVIQLIEDSGDYYLWTHWGRVGESGQNSLQSCHSLDRGISEFKKKFLDKTKNHWDERDEFQPAAGKYTLVEIDHSTGTAEEEVAGPVEVKIPKNPKSNVKCTLDEPTQDFIKLIFDHDMFKAQMKEMEIDVEKMPLGKLTKAQVQKGHEALQDIIHELEASSPSTSRINQLSSTFYSVIPHAFGRRVPPPLNTLEKCQGKVDLLNTLADIEHAQSLLKSSDGGASGPEMHEFDRNYKLLKNELTLVDKKSQEFTILDTYLRQTTYAGFKGEILEVWRLDREGEKQRMDKHKNISYRKLLWHGTSVAVVVAILSSGLRIMPHSGGRVGRGIYHASEHSKSAGYTGKIAGNIGIMFLDEVVLGKQYKITKDDPSLKVAPSGYDSVLAVGEKEPDPSKETTIEGEWGPIVVPQGKPIVQAEGKGSYFDQSEYLVYQESQVRMKYVLKIRF